MAHGATLGHLEPEDDPKQSHGLYPRSSSSMAPRPYSPRTWNMGRQGSRHTKISRTSELAKTRWIKWTRLETWHSARYQQSLRRYQAQRVRCRDLNKGDLVLRLRQDNRGRHKLTLPWEGPYIVAEVLKPGTYKLANEKGEVFTNAWNIQQLCRFYP